MLILGYVRVSSIEQEQGFGPEVQEEAIRAHAASMGKDRAVEFVHESVSAESIVARVELKQLLHRAKDAQSQGIETHIIMYRLDRLARNLTDQETVVGFALKHGFRLHSTFAAESETLDPAYAGDPMRVLIRQVFGAFAQLDRANIQARLDGGLAAKAKTGGATGGRTPFGYMTRDNDIIVDPIAAPIVIRVFELSRQGLDQASIAAMCAREFPLRCSTWGKCNISRMLKRRRLYGHGLYRSRAGVNEVERPELRILPEREGVTAVANAGGPVDWSRFPDPIATGTLSMLIDRPYAWIQKHVSAHSFAVQWLKGRMLLKRSDARLLERIAESERESKGGP